jgi:hypothetical protein
MDVVQRQRGDDGVRGRQRLEEARLLERDSIPVAGQPPTGLAEHLGIDIEDGHVDAGKPAKHCGRQCACTATEIEDMPGGRGERREQLDARREHVVVVRNEPANLNVVAVRLDIEVPPDRMRLITGHDTILDRARS